MGDLRAFLADAPPGVAALRIERFKAHSAGSLMQALVPLDAEVGTDDRPTGRKVIWASESGQALATQVIHPAPVDIEQTLLPMCFHAAALVSVEVQLWCESGTLLDPQRMIEKWDPRDPPGRAAESIASLRDGELGPAQREAAAALTRHGWIVRTAGGTVEAERHWRTSASPWMLAVLPALLFFGLPLFIVRLWPGLFTQVGDLWRAATSSSSRRLRYEISASGITVRVSANGVEQPPMELPLDRVGALSYAPAGVAYADPHDSGALRVVHSDGCTYLPHTAAGAGGTRTVDTAKADREVGSALHALLRATLSASSA